MDCLIPRLGKARSLSDAPPASAPTLVGACVPCARPAPRSAVGHPAHGAGRRGRRPLPPILPRRGLAREGLAPPSAWAVRRRVCGGGVKPRAGQPQNLSPCPRTLRAPARPHVRLSDTTRTGRAAEDVGPYHPSCPERTRRGTSERARRGTSPGGRVAIHCDRGRRASCRSTRSARRHEGTEEVESWFTRTAVTFHRIP